MTTRQQCAASAGSPCGGEGVMDAIPICLCAHEWPGQGHHPECPVRHEIESLRAQLAEAKKQPCRSCKYDAGEVNAARSTMLEAQAQVAALREAINAAAEQRQYQFSPYDTGWQDAIRWMNQKTSALRATAPEPTPEPAGDALYVPRSNSSGQPSWMPPPAVKGGGV